MKYLNLSKKIAGFAITALVFTGCDKVTVQQSIGDAGQTLVKILGGGTPASITKAPVDFVPVATKLQAADIRRDIPNATALNTVMHVIVKNDNAAVTAANPAYVILPSAWYTIDASTPFSGGNYNVTLNAGEFAKQIYITITDPTLLDPSTLYGLGFTITAADDGGKISTQKSVVLEIGAKNAYDGVYRVTGSLVDVSSVAGANLFGPWLPYWEALLVTTSNNSCNVYDNTYTGLVAHPFFNNGANTYFGSFGIQIYFNTATNQVAELRNWWGVVGNAAGASGPPDYAAGNTRRCLLDPSGTNTFNPGTHNVAVKYWMIQPSIMGSLTPRVYFNENWTYTGPR